MRAYNKRYKNITDLKTFIHSNNIHNQKNILLQIFTAICDVDFIDRLTSDIKEIIPHINIIGSTTSGEILEEEALEDSTILSFSVFEATTIKTYFADIEKDQSTTEVANKLISKFDPNQNPKVAISFTDGLHTNGEEFVNSFYDYDPKLILSGGLAGDNQQFQKTIVFTQDKILTNGVVVALLYGDKLMANTFASFGWESIGKKMTITKAKGNVVYEIDNQQAVDIYAKYLGEDVAKGLPKIGVEFPLLVKRDGLFIPRAVVSKKDDNSLVFAGNLKIGDEVTFGYGNIEAILNYSSHISLPQESEAIFVYSCMARKMLMGESVSFELFPLTKVATVSGFFTYGEFYSNNNSAKNTLLNETMTILSLSEGDNENTFVQINSNKTKIRDRRKSSLTLRALSHLISQTSFELEEINKTLEKRIRKEVAKNRHKDQLMLQQTKLAQMGEMINMIAHQWRQPLSAISATTNDLYLKIMLDNFSKDYFSDKLQQIEKLSQHLSSTIDDFRSFYKQDKEKVSTLFSEITKNVLNIVSLSLKNKNIKLITDFNCEKQITTYPNEIKQVILNLIKNSEDVLVEKDVKDPYVHIKTYDTNEHSCFELKDNGGGIPEDIKDKIFEPYFSTKLKKDGTGLGLYMSKIIVEDHCNGKIEVSNNDEGAVFCIKIPIAQGNKA